MTSPNDPRVQAVTAHLQNDPRAVPRLLTGDVAAVFTALGDLGMGVCNLPATPDLAEVSPGRTRNPDHATSRRGAHDVAYRAGSQKHLLLARFEEAGWGGLTDEEAGTKAALGHTCYWKRCGELRAAGLVEDTGRTRLGTAGSPRIVSRITDPGEALLRRLAR